MEVIIFEKADKNLFAIYQTVYSQADIELWFDWEARLNDTKWTDDCYFLSRDGEKIGGAVIMPNLVMFPFFVPPFCDSALFWKLVLKQAAAICTEAEIQLKGMLPEQAEALMRFGAEVWRPRQIMCRPTDSLPYMLSEGFLLETPGEKEIPALAQACRDAYLGGIVYSAFGESTVEEICGELQNGFQMNRETDSTDQLVIARQKATGKLAGACIAGIHSETPHLFASITDVFVLPDYRGKGLAEAMLRHTVTMAHRRTPVIKLHVLVGNPAENLYRKLGFVPGPRFTDMKYRVGLCQ